MLVVDLFGKIEDGTFIGDNLGTTIHSRAKTGLVVDGGIRDLERVYELPDFNVFCRGVHPSAIWEVTPGRGQRPDPDRQRHGAAGRRRPRRARRGQLHAAAPGRGGRDALRGRPATGRLRQERMAEGIYTSGQIDVSIWDDEIEADYVNWCAEQGLEEDPRR